MWGNPPWVQIPPPPPPRTSYFWSGTSLTRTCAESGRELPFVSATHPCPPKMTGTHVPVRPRATLTSSDGPVFCPRRLDRDLQRRMGANFADMSAEAKYLEDAIDVLILEEEDDDFVMLIATHDQDDVTSVFSQVRAAARLVEEDADWNVVRNLPELTPESDLFLWMIYKWARHDGKLSKDLEIIAYNTLSARNANGGVTRSLRGIDLERIDTLGAVAEDQVLGPASSHSTTAPLASWPTFSYCSTAHLIFTGRERGMMVSP